MAVTVVVRPTLNSDAGVVQALHDSVTGATKDIAMQAGDISRHTFLSPINPRDFLGIDVWASAEAFQRFSSDPKNPGVLRPDVRWNTRSNRVQESGWNKW